MDPTTITLTSPTQSFARNITITATKTLADPVCSVAGSIFLTSTSGDFQVVSGRLQVFTATNTFNGTVQCAQLFVTSGSTTQCIFNVTDVPGCANGQVRSFFGIQLAANAPVQELASNTQSFSFVSNTPVSQNCSRVYDNALSNRVTGTKPSVNGTQICASSNYNYVANYAFPSGSCGNGVVSCCVMMSSSSLGQAVGNHCPANHHLKTSYLSVYSASWELNYAIMPTTGARKHALCLLLMTGVLQTVPAMVGMVLS